MSIFFINKLLLLLLIMSSLVCVRNLFFFIQSWVTSNSEEPKRFILNKRELFILCISIAYVIVCILTGVKI